jgi:hypothetical protein
MQQDSLDRCPYRGPCAEEEGAEPENVSAPTMREAINRCERVLRVVFSQVRWLFFEPDVTS